MLKPFKKHGSYNNVIDYITRDIELSVLSADADAQSIIRRYEIHPIGDPKTHIDPLIHAIPAIS